ncbi:MAG: hypothetical protein Q9163_001483 [Psora crenata]
MHEEHPSPSRGPLSPATYAPWGIGQSPALKHSTPITSFAPASRRPPVKAETKNAHRGSYMLAKPIDTPGQKPSSSPSVIDNKQADAYLELLKPPRLAILRKSAALGRELLPNYPGVTYAELATEIAVYGQLITHNATSHHREHSCDVQSSLWIINPQNHRQCSTCGSFTCPLTHGLAHRIFNTGIVSLCHRLEPGFDPSRLCIKVVSTWEGLQACRKLKSMGIKTLATTLFTMEQAILAAESGCAYMSPFLHELKAFFDEKYIDNEPCLDLCFKAQGYLKEHSYDTRVKVAGLLTVDQAMCLAGSSSMTVAPTLLRELFDTHDTKAALASRSLFQEKVKAQEQGVERISFINDETKYREAFAKSNDGKGAAKTAQSFRASKTFTTFVVCTAVFTDTLLLNIIVPILPPFLLGLGFLGGATLSFALGKSITFLLLARLLQGFSSAAVFTFGLALLQDKVGNEEIGWALGLTGAAMSAALLLGPVIGGLLYEHGGYFTVFLPNLCLIVAELFLRLIIIDENRTPCVDTLNDPSKCCRQGTETAHSNRLNGAATAQDGDFRSDTSNQVLDTASQNRDEGEPLLPNSCPKGNAYLILLCSPRFMVAIGGLFLLSSIANGFDAILPPYILEVFSLSPSYLALLYLIMGLPMLLAPIAGALTDRYGPKIPATASLVMLTMSLLLLRLITPAISWPIYKLMALLFVVGNAFAFAMPPLQTEVSAVVREMERTRLGVFGKYGGYSQAYGLMNTAFAAGSMLGPLYAGFVQLCSGWSAVTLLMAFLSAVVLLFVLCLTGGQVAGG